MAVVELGEALKYYEFEMTKLMLPSASQEDLDRIAEELGLLTTRTVDEED